MRGATSRVNIDVNRRVAASIPAALIRAASVEASLIGLHIYVRRGDECLWENEHIAGSNSVDAKEANKTK